MCTVSWAKRPNGYSLFFNRDESRERPAGLPPGIDTIDNTQFVCPRDPVGGGTWLLVNEHGLSLGLLNYYEAQVDYQPKNPQSRGQLPIQLAVCKNLAQVEAILFELDLSPYPPFHLLSVDPKATASLITWDGKLRSIQKPDIEDLPISTSSFKTSEVLQSRRTLFRETTLPNLGSDAEMERFHSQRKPAPDTHAVLMTRRDAKTVSVSQINVTDSKASFIYRARPTDSEALEQPVTQTIDLS